MNRQKKRETKKGEQQNKKVKREVESLKELNTQVPSPVQYRVLGSPLQQCPCMDELWGHLPPLEHGRSTGGGLSAYSAVYVITTKKRCSVE